MHHEDLEGTTNLASPKASKRADAVVIFGEESEDEAVVDANAVVTAEDSDYAEVHMPSRKAPFHRVETKETGVLLISYRRFINIGIEAVHLPQMNPTRIQTSHLSFVPTKRCKPQVPCDALLVTSLTSTLRTLHPNTKPHSSQEQWMTP